MSGKDFRAWHCVLFSLECEIRARASLLLRPLHSGDWAVIFGPALRAVC